MQVFGPFCENCRFGVAFWRPLDFEGGPKIDHVLTKLKKNKKDEVQEAGWKKTDLFIDL